MGHGAARLREVWVLRLSDRVASREREGHLCMWEDWSGLSLSLFVILSC